MAKPQGEDMLTALLVAVVLMVATASVWFPRLIIWLGDFDEWWSPYRTLPPEGEMYVIGLATMDGPFDSLLESVSGFVYDKDLHEFREDKNKPPRKGFLNGIGVAKVGFNKQIIEREVRYDKWEKLPNSPNWGLVPKVRTGPSIYFQYTMATKVEKVESMGNIPVSATVSFTVQIFSPKKALFFAGGWEVRTVAEVQALIRHHVGSKTIDKLREEKTSGNSELVASMIEPYDPDNFDPKKFSINRELYSFGVRIISATFIDYDLEAGDAESNRAIKAKQIAELQGDAKITEAEKGLKVAELQAQAITVEYEARVSSGGEHTGTLRMAEAIENTNLQALGSGVVVGIDNKK